MIARADLYAPDFPVYYNDKMYKLDWFQRPTFNTNKPVDIGIDQSSTSTGLCIQNSDILMIMELPRGDTTLNEYKQALTQQFDALFSSLVIRHLIYEKHGRHISPLHALINEITYTIKSYTKPLIYDDVYVKGILPPVWRSGFLISDNYKGKFRREEVKIACVNEAIKRNESLKQYVAYANKKDGVPDYDGFESYGIINGFLDLNYTKDGERIVNTSMEFRNGREFNYIIEKTNSLDINETKLRLKQRYGSRDCKYILGNNKLLLDNSMNRVLDDYDDVIMEIPKDHPEIPRLIIETRKEFNPEDRYLIYIRKH